MSSSQTWDVVVIGAGPNGLSAAVELARAKASVLVLEAAAEPGGGARTKELTLPGFHHDVCSAVHPLGALSPFFKGLSLERHGLKWLAPKVSVAHPLDDGPAVLLRRSLEETSLGLGADAERYRALLGPLVGGGDTLVADLLGPLRVPRAKLPYLRFGWAGQRSAVGLANAAFREPRAKALFAGCAAHSIRPLEGSFTAAVGLLFALSGHLVDWPVAEGGSGRLASALVGLLRELGTEVRVGQPVRSLRELPPSKALLFDTGPDQLSRLAEAHLPAGYLRRLGRFRFGPGVFKLDWALDGPIPWRAPECAEASTVHVGGTLEEVAAAEAAVWRGQHPERPFVLVCQQSHLDPGRAPAGRHTGYAYCHVPAGSDVDLTSAVEAQVERFAPGFKDRVLARHAMRTADFERYNPNNVGGSITGGVADLAQLFTRPVARLDPYSTPNPHLFLCSASTPPGGGVHGMCGFHAARSVLRGLSRLGPVSW